MRDAQAHLNEGDVALVFLWCSKRPAVAVVDGAFVETHVERWDCEDPVSDDVGQFVFAVVSP